MIEGLPGGQALLPAKMFKALEFFCVGIIEDSPRGAAETPAWTERLYGGWGSFTSEKLGECTVERCLVTSARLRILVHQNSKPSEVRATGPVKGRTLEIRLGVIGGQPLHVGGHCHIRAGLHGLPQAPRAGAARTGGPTAGLRSRVRAGLPCAVHKLRAGIAPGGLRLA